jgi:2,5-diketo-D-gluconate reductase A
VEPYARRVEHWWQFRDTGSLADIEPANGGRNTAFSALAAELTTQAGFLRDKAPVRGCDAGVCHYVEVIDSAAAAATFNTFQGPHMTDPKPISFHDGHSIPQLGFGIWQIPQDKTATAVASALRLGYRLIDGAYVYGNEAGLGEGLRTSGIAHDEVFVTTKVWNREQGRDKARASVERSLKSIGVDQLDLVLIHWPVPSQDLYVETWKAMIEMRNEGLMRSIGVSNFNADHLTRLMEETGEPPVLNQIEINPQLQQPELRAFCESHKIVVQAWTPLGNGKSFEADPVKAAAARTGKSPAQVILRWHVQLGHAVIARSVNPDRQAENLDIFDFTLTDDEMKAIAGLDVGLRNGPDPSVFKLL